MGNIQSETKMINESDIEQKLDEADSVSEQISARYSSAKVFGRARNRIYESSEK
ncbi:MAG: hypothetical protein SOI44_06770 [Lactimicrobium sp.]|jgi:hypothetical protein|uniref:hypothetical protein n=1 Tax=Lactimicrobium sp. TaxID=2563780 RepID=UPI002F3542C0